ncbi:MAG: hypothetical protein IKX29_06860 [Bacteroidales bacterium]|nr:hypothetical protein [Bacteroidales bacterium]
MQIKLAAALLLLPTLLSAQERVTVCGRIVNEQGTPVEYVQVGVPKHQIGTVSTADGRFEIAMPPDTLQFFHVSYQAASCPVTGPVDDLVIVMHDQELPPAVLIGGDTKEKYLLRAGKTLMKNMGVISITFEDGNLTGKEVGSVAQTKKPFLVQDISLTVHDNRIPDCVASVNIYRIEGQEESFVNVLHRPIYFDVAVSDTPRQYHLRPNETLLLEPGRYFIAFQIVGCDEAALQAFLAKPMKEQIHGMYMNFYIYLKSSYVREAALGEMKHYPVNIGIAVKGLEYQ